MQMIGSATELSFPVGRGRQLWTGVMSWITGCVSFDRSMIRYALI